MFSSAMFGNGVDYQQIKPSSILINDHWLLKKETDNSLSVQNDFSGSFVEAGNFPPNT